MKKQFFRIFSFAFAFLFCIGTFVGCDQASDEDLTESSGETSGVESGSSDGLISRWKNESGVSVSSGGHTVSPLSGFSHSYQETTEEDTGWNASGIGAGGILADPIDTYPTLIRNGDVTVTLPVNGMISSVAIIDSAASEREKRTVTLEELSELPAGDYCVILTVLLSGNCDPDAPQSSTCYEDVFRLVVYEEN